MHSFVGANGSTPAVQLCLVAVAHAVLATLTLTVWTEFPPGAPLSVQRQAAAVDELLSSAWLGRGEPSDGNLLMANSHWADPLAAFCLGTWTSLVYWRACARRA
jgi:hypothetical protein